MSRKMAREWMYCVVRAWKMVATADSWGAFSDVRDEEVEAKGESTFVVEEEEDFERREVVSEIAACSVVVREEEVILGDVCDTEAASAADSSANGGAVKE